MKKLIAALLCMTMATTMFMGCAKEEPKTEEPEVNTDAEEEAPEEEAVDAKVSVFWYDESDVYLGTVRDALNKELDALGVEYDNQFAANTQSTQLDQIKTAISAGSNLLVVNVVTSGAPDVAEDILAAAGDIPVIFFNRAIGTDGSDVDVLESVATSCFIGTDAPEAGHMQGKMIGDYVVANYDTIDINGDGNISYAMFMGDIANVEAIYRTQYGVEDADAVITAAGKPALVYFDAANADKYQVDQAGAWSAKAAKEYMETNFVTYNEDAGNMIELIICNNDGMAEGAVAALQEKGYNVDGAHVVPVFGVDATDNAKSLIAEGAMAGTIKQDAEGMAAAIAQTVDAVAGGAAMADVFAGMTDARFSVAADCTTKLFVAYAPYTGE
jgi:methyl-galactoside transport system substrate-binding protein